MNYLKQLYQSVKILHKACEVFTLSNIQKGNAQIRYQQYYIDRSILVLNTFLKNNVLSDSERRNCLLHICKITQGKTGYNFLIQEGMKPWDNDVKDIRNNAYNEAFEAIGKYIYPWIDENGRLEYFQITELLNKDSFEKYIENIDQELMNEDIWLMLYAVDFLLTHNKIAEAKYLIVSIVSSLTLQGALLKSKKNYQCSEQMIHIIFSLLKSDLTTKENMNSLYSQCLYWAKLQGFNISNDKREYLSWIEGYFKLEQSQDEDEHIRWDSVKEA